MVILSIKFKPLLYAILPLYSHLPFFYLFLGPALLAISFVKIAPIKYRMNTKINPCSKVIFSCLKDYKTKLHDFLYATLLYVTPG